MHLMETKEDLIKIAIGKLLKISQLYARVEETPIPVGEGLSLTTREVHYVMVIGKREPVNITNVAGLFGVSKSASSQMVIKLENKGLINKKLSPHSSKEYELSLTPLGWKAFNAHELYRGADRAELIERLSGFPISQIATLSVLLEEMENVMEKCLSKR